MKIAKPTLFFAGIFVALVGLIWVGQGTGYFPYPASSFMIDQRPWAYYGLAMFLAGLAMMFFSRRR
jgi:hypothetical protein